MIGAVHAPATRAQSAVPRNEPQAEFEAASIRPASPMRETFSGVERSGGSGRANNCGIQRLRMDESLVSYQCVPLKVLIEYAYGIGEIPGQMVGPHWMMDISPGQLFDIEAKIPAGVSKDRVPEMFQTLLVKRFGLVFHRGQQYAPAYALTIDKSGLKLKTAEASPGVDFVADANAPPSCPQENFRCAPHIRNADGVQTVMTPLSPSVRRITNPRIGTALETNVPGSGKIRLDAPSTTMAGLADLMPLFGNGGRTVDMTGRKGRFQVVLNISLLPDGIDPATGAFAQPDGLAPATTAVSPLFDGYRKALQKVGLRLEPIRLPAETIVIDRLEKTPTEN
jgi:uncharacterized protein (TIGR03435 family)